jgi:hypothetical protein
MKIAIIDGASGSGKSTLRGLLDGHPQVFTLPVHECFIGATFGDKDQAAWIKKRDLVAFRKALATSGYYRLERDSIKQSFISMASGGDVQHLPFNFDFYSMDRLFMSRIAGTDPWTADVIASIFYNTAAEVWGQYPGNVNDYSVAVTMDNNVDSLLELIENDSINMKMLWVDRPVESILATHYNRRPLPGIVGTMEWGSRTAQEFIKSGYVSQLEAKRIRIESLALSHPSKFMIVPLKLIVEETKSVMPKVAEFLDICSSDSLYTFSYCGASHEGSDRYIGKINDIPEDVFSNSELKDIRDEVIKVRSCNNSKPESSKFLRRFRRRLTWN